MRKNPAEKEKGQQYQSQTSVLKTSIKFIRSNPISLEAPLNGLNVLMNPDMGRKTYRGC
jgi:hypothetical protein